MSDTAQLVLAAIAGITILVVLIIWAKLHPILALNLGSFVVGAVAAQNLNDVVLSSRRAFGMSAAGVGVLIALGAMFGKLLFDSGGADEIVDTIVGRSSASVLPWTMAAVGGLIGLPMFFEIGGQQLDQGHSRLHRYAPGRVVDRSPRRDVHPRPGSRDGQGGAHQDDRAVAPADSPASS